MPMTGSVICVDLASIKNIPNVTTIVGDITTKKCLRSIQHELKGAKVDVLLNDGSPNVGSNWLKDAYTQSDLVLQGLKIGTELMKKGAIYITKVFRSKDYTSLIWLLNQFFEKVEATKPKASRHTSAEIYVICFNYKAPKEIDPKLFDANFVFEEVTQKKKISIQYEKKKRNRDGYEDGNYLLYKELSVSKFIDADNPVNVLAEYGALVWDEESQKYLNHPETTEEIKTLVKDTQLMGRYDFKYLLKWRRKMIEFRDHVPEDQIQSDSGSEGEEEYLPAPKQENLEQVDSEVLEKELNELRKKALNVKKNLEKRKKIKDKKRMPKASELTEKETDILDNYQDTETFSLQDLSTKDALDKINQSQGQDLDDLITEEEEEKKRLKEERDAIRRNDFVESDSEVEETINDMYQQYLERKTPKQKARLLEARSKEEKKREDLFKTIEEEKEIDEDEPTSNPLLAKIKFSDSRKEQQWFGQNIFNVLNEEDDTDLPKAKKKKVERDEDDSEGENSDEGDYQQLRSEIKKNKEGDSFETVPKELHDEDTRAVTLALATKLLRRKERQQFIDNAYNRYAFNDKGPEWFEDDERKHNKPSKPITREDVRKMKEKFKEINAAPMKKVLEAQFRKKRKMKEKLEKVKEKATAVADNPDLSNTEKAKELQKLYKKASGKESRKRIYIVGKKGSRMVSGRSGNAHVKVVDTRMKKDLKKQKQAEKSGKGKRKR